MTDLDEFAKAIIHGFIVSRAIRVSCSKIINGDYQALNDDGIIEFGFDIAEKCVAESKRRKDKNENT